MDDDDRCPGPRPILRFDRGTLVLEGAPTASSNTEPFPTPGPPWRWDTRTGAWRCDALHYRAVRSALRGRLGDGLDDRVQAGGRLVLGAGRLPELRPDQQRAVEAWRAGGGRGVIVMPTGTGKTEVALAVVAYSRCRALVVAPVRDLMHQWHARMRAALAAEVGVVGDGRHEIRALTVTTYHSAFLHMDAIGASFDLVVFDEVHHLPGGRFQEAALRCAARFRLGLPSTRQAQQRLGRILRRTGAARAVLYEVVCRGTREIEESRVRRRCDAFAKTRHLRS